MHPLQKGSLGFRVRTPTHFGYHMGAMKSTKHRHVAGRAAERLDAALRVDADAARREHALVAMATLLVSGGCRACSSPREVNRLMPDGEWFRTRHELRRVTGGRKAALRRLAAGGIVPAGRFGAWSPDFWAGLRLSGAIHPDSHPREWVVRFPRRHEALLEDMLGEAPFMRRWSDSKRGVTLWSLWAAEMGADDPAGAGVLAGLMAGARRLDDGQGMGWAVVTDSLGARRLLGDLMVPFVVERRRRGLALSPFWGALVAHMMPAASAERYRLWLRPACCPLLPWAFLAHAWGKGFAGMRRHVPWASARPWAIRGRFPTEGRRLRRAGLDRLGFLGVSPVLRAAWLEGARRKGLDFEGGMCHDGLVKGEEGTP